MRGQIMKKRIICIFVAFALWVPGIIYGEDPSVLHPKEWYILEKIPVGKGLGIGIFLFQEGMPIEHIQSVFGKPKEIIAIEVEGYDGMILVYPHHHFFFSKTGNLQNIKERNLQTVPTVK
jgi:hypothetical protein